MPVSHDNCLMGTSELALLVGQTLFHFKCFISQEEIPRNCVPQQLKIKDLEPFLWWECSLFRVFEVFTDWVLEEKLWVGLIRQTASSIVRPIPESEHQFENWDIYQ